ncbi:MAG: DUF4340 domain-containing protein [Spirochaetia bacterium]|jgi:hypothetical protein|nr:DUF4340 domain-containing protein [Spirochaetia bacterium]
MEFIKKIKILSVLIVALTALYISGLVFSSANIQKKKSDEKIFDKNLIEKIEIIKIDSEDGLLSFKKEGEGWVIQLAKSSYPAPLDKIENLIDSVSNITKYQISGTDSKSWAKFDLEEEKAKKAIFQDGNGNPLFTLYVGKAGPGNEGGEYIRSTLSEEVYLLDAPINRYFIRDKNYWSNLRVFPSGFDTSSIVSVKIKSDIRIEDEIYNIDLLLKKEKKDTGSSYSWINNADAKAADRNKTDLMINNIITINGDSFTEENFTEKNGEIEIESDVYGRLIFDFQKINEESVIYGLRGNSLRYEASIYKIRRFLNSVNEIFEEPDPEPVPVS